MAPLRFLSGLRGDSSVLSGGAAGGSFVGEGDLPEFAIGDLPQTVVGGRWWVKCPQLLVNPSV